MPLLGPRIAQQGAEVGHIGVDKDEERSMNMDVDSFPAGELISWISQALYPPSYQPQIPAAMLRIHATLAQLIILLGLL